MADFRLNDLLLELSRSTAHLPGHQVERSVEIDGSPVGPDAELLADGTGGFAVRVGDHAALLFRSGRISTMSAGDGRVDVVLDDGMTVSAIRRPLDTRATDLAIACARDDEERLTLAMTKADVSHGISHRLHDGELPFVVVSGTPDEALMTAISRAALAGPIGVVLPDPAAADEDAMRRLVAVPDPMPLSFLMTAADAIERCGASMDRVLGADPNGAPVRPARVTEPDDPMERMFGDHVFERERLARSTYVLRDEMQLETRRYSRLPSSLLDGRRGFDHRAVNEAPRSARRRRR